MAKSNKKADIKVKAAKKTKAGDSKKSVATIPSAKHDAPISSKEILARVCIYIVFSHTYICISTGSAKKCQKDQEEG
jgi:hypothetical protein